MGKGIHAALCVKKCIVTSVVRAAWWGYFIRHRVAGSVPGLSSGTILESHEDRNLEKGELPT
jgi:hypothetical protein